MKPYSKLLLPALLLAASTASAQPAGIGSSCTPPPNGMIGWWTGDGHAKDIKSGHNARLKGSATADAKGMVAKAFDLNKADHSDYVIVKNQAPFAFSSTRSFTIDAWVLADKKQTQGAVGIINKSKSADGGRYALQLYTDGNGVSKADFFTSEGQGAGDNENLKGRSQINDGKWHHLTATYDAKTQTKRLYVDGVLDANKQQIDVVRDNFHSTGALIFGGSKKKNFNGYLDEVEIFDHTLSKGEIGLIVVAGKYGKCKPKPTDITLNSGEAK